MHDSPPDRRDWLSRLLSRLAYQAALRPGQTLLAAGLITCLAAGLAFTRLEFRTSRLDLLSASANYNQRWLNYLDRFGNEDDAVVVISHSDPQRVSQVLTAVGQRLEADQQLSGVLYRKSLGEVAGKALHLMPPGQLQQLVQLLQSCHQLLDMVGDSSRSPASTASQIPSQTWATTRATTDTQSLINQLSAAITQAQTGLDRLQQSVPRQGPLLLEDHGRLGVCLVRLPHVDDQPTKAPALIATLDQHLQAMRGQYPDVDIWLTGMPVLEWDESQSSQRDMQNATLLSLLGVAFIFMFGFGSWRMPCAAVTCLTLGLIWTVGLATLFVGHLNLFSVAFGAIIAGLGIDYAIHLLSRLQTQNTDSAQAPIDADEFHCPPNDLPQALANAVDHCGKGIFTGAITTAAAFAVALLTPFRGMTELGLICALGTITCMLVTLTVLPALLVWQARSMPPRRRPSENIFSLSHIHAWIMLGLQWSNQSTLRWRWAVLLSTGCVTLMSAAKISHVRYDHNLLNLQADDVPSVHAERELTRRSGQSAWFAISLANSPEEAQALHQRLVSLPSVARVEELGSVLADSRGEHTQLFVSTCRQQAAELIQRITSLAVQQLAVGAPPVASLQLVLPASYQAASSLDPEFKSQIQLLANSISQLSIPEPPALMDFPDAVRSRMVSNDGNTFLLRVFAKENLWQRENLGQFVKELESVDPRVTGHPVQTWYASGELENSYYQAGIYALLAVMALLMIDLGSLRLVALALIPVAISSIQLCGMLVSLNIPLNAANMIVLPLIIGIGIDDGVHIIHDFARRGRARYQISASTSLAIVLTSLTTMVGFGSMALADHRGLQSLGIVLLLGVGLCMTHSWFTLPALLSYLGPQPVPAPAPISRWALAPVSSSRSALSPVPSAEPTDDVKPEQTQQTQPSPTLADNEVPLLLRDVPVFMSLPDYPECRW
ncbi:MAG: MMPL family transporter [Pirellulaceae bacterium]|nr:MMPL family transporter [Pirellulaceae bacterium]